MLKSHDAIRLDKALTIRGIVSTRSQAEHFIKLGKVRVNGKIAQKPGMLLFPKDHIILTEKQQYVGRAGLKLASIVPKLGLQFTDKIVLDVGSSTGGFTDYALQHGAARVIAVDVGTDQMHPRLRASTRIELHEKTDIRLFQTKQVIDIVLADVSFISLRDILPTIARLTTTRTQIVVMVKPQFEARQSDVKHKGVIKNDRLRREIFKDFEQWLQTRFVLHNKVDSEVSGAKGNKERFYLLSKI